MSLSTHPCHCNFSVVTITTLATSPPLVIREPCRCYVCRYGLPTIFSMVATVLIPMLVFFALHMLFKQR
jgi:hypothetical protein